MNLTKDDRSGSIKLMAEQSAQAQPKTSSAPPSKNKNLLIVIIVIAILVLLGGGYFVQQQFAEKSAEKTIEQATGADVDVSEGGDKVTIETDEGKVTIGKNEVPDNFPSDIAIYNGSEVTGTSETTDGVSVILKTSDSVSTVNNFYKDDLAKNGWKITLSSTAEGSSVISAEKGEKSVIITISVDNEDGKTGIAIVVSGI